MTISDSSARSREAHRLLAFIYFTFAEADASWVNEETIALYDFLERQAGELTREESIALAQEAYGRYLELGDAGTRLQYIESHAHAALGHLSHDERREILNNLLTLARVDGEVSSREDSLASRVRRLLRELPGHSHQHPHPHPSYADEIRLISFIYFTLADADHNWTNEETFALYDLLEKQSGVADREKTIALAQEAFVTLQGVDGHVARVRRIAELAPQVFARHDEEARKQLLRNLIEIARADGKFSSSEAHLLEDIQQILLGPSHSQS